MRKIANFIVEKHKWIMVVFVVLTIAAAICIPQVEINSDLTKYLPDDFNMKIGMDKMNGEFGESASETTAIRVMFTGLSDAQKTEMKDRLESTEFVDNVAYDPGSEDYNKDEYTKYDLTVAGVYGSDEEKSVTLALDNDFTDYEMVYVIDDMAAKEIPKTVSLIAVGILVAILLIMSGSWIEPLLLVITIGMAIIMNIGSNLIMGTVSNTTQSLAPILQLVLSMDYSIILMNRYHQELEKVPVRKAAMKSAWTQAFSSIFSSSFTTIIGLLALVFMTFKLGRDVGFVLAKGVLISVITVLMFLPGLAMAFTPIIQKTKKKVPVIPTKGLAKYSHKCRWVIVPVFLSLFVGVCFLQQNTELSYTIPTTDEISEVFPTSQTVVLLYDNKDEDIVTSFEDEMENHENIISVTGYGNMIGKEYTADEMYDRIGELGDGETELSKSIVNMLYYSYFENGKVSPMTAAEFIDFLTDDVIHGEEFASQIDDSLRENIDDLKKFSDADKLQKQMSMKELADFIGIDEDTCKSVFLLYYIDNGGVETGKMTVRELLSFIVNDLAANENFSDTFDKSQLDTVKNLLEYTDKAEMTTPISYKKAAQLLNMDESTMKLLYVYYYANSANYSPNSMTLPELVTFLKNDVLSDKKLSSQFGGAMANTLNTLGKFTDSNIFNKQMNAAELAKLLGIDQKIIQAAFTSDTSGVADKTMTIDEFLGFVVNNVMNQESYSSLIDDSVKQSLNAAYQTVQAAKSGNTYTADQLAAVTEINEDAVNQIFTLYFKMNPTGKDTVMTLQTFTNFIVNDVMPNETYGALLPDQAKVTVTTLNTLINAAVSGTKFGINELSQISGMSEQLVTNVFALRFYDAGKTMSPREFVRYVLDNGNASQLGSSTASTLRMLDTVMNASTNGTPYDYKAAASLFSMDESTMKLLYTYKASSNSNWRLSVQTLLNYIGNNKDYFSGIADSDTISGIEMLRTIVNSSVSGTRYTSDGIVKLVNLDPGTVNKLYLLNISENGDTSDWKMSIQKFVDFLSSNLQTNEDIADRLETDTADQIGSVQTLVNAVIDGKKFTPTELSDVVSGFTEEMKKSTLELLYLYHDSKASYNTGWKINLLDMVDYITGHIFNDPKFEDFLDAEKKSSILDTKETLYDAINSLQGDQYSRVLLRVKDLTEMDSINAFYDEANEKLGGNLKGDYYFISDSAMSYEMSKTFGTELTLITLLTALAIFIVVALTFKNLALPAILVLIVQCGIYIAVSVVGLQGMSMYYLTLLMVECILMGSTIDYGILFSTYYRDSRKTMSVLDSLIASYRGSIETIMTSGSILVIITGVLSEYFPDPSTAQICRNISIGALSAVVLILFILPGVLAALDKFVKKKAKKKKHMEV